MAKKVDFDVGLTLKDAQNMFKQKGKTYNHTFMEFGEMMNVLFPEGLMLESPNDFARFGILNHVCTKVMRYCRQFEDGGHLDSAADLVVYAAMLKTLTGE